jgi:predicted nucleic acid-binding protein
MEWLEVGRESAWRVAKLKEDCPDISTFDLMIAGICLSHDVGFITRESDFQEVEENGDNIGGVFILVVSRVVCR